MLIKEEKILQLIEEEAQKYINEVLILEQARWAIPDDKTYEYSLTPDGKGYIAYKGGKALGTFKDVAGLKKVKDAAPPTAAASTVGGQPGPPEPVFRDFEKDVGLEPEHEFSKRSPGEALSAASLYAFAAALKPIAMTGPPGFSEPMKFFFHFMAINKGVYNVKAPDLRRGMHYVCMAAQRRGSPKTVSYSDYQTGQKLAGREQILPTFARDGGSFQSVFSFDPFQAMSACFGSAEYSGSPETGFTVTDSFNFNLDRDKSQVEKASEYIASVPGVLALIGRLTGGEHGTDPGGRAVGAGLVAKIEEILVMYEHTLRYTGFPTMIKTIPPKASLGITDKFRDFYS
jgi:hypothetical protein